MNVNLLGSFIFFSFINLHFCNIHRAIPGTWSLANPFKVRSNSIIDEIEEEDDQLGFFDKVLLKSNTAWLYAIPAALLVGSTGILPLLVFNTDDGKELKESISPSNLKLLLSFAVGGLLGDVFLHLLPESWMYLNKGSHDHTGGLKIGLWVLAGLLCFLILEKIFFEESKMKEQIEKQTQKKLEKVTKKLNGVSHKNGVAEGLSNDKTNGKTNGDRTNGHINGVKNGYSNDHIEKNSNLIKRNKKKNEKENTPTTEPGDQDDEDYSADHIKVIGYLNLLANCIDNFTHGLAVAGSFTVGIPVGICTTFAILLHEIPHEIGDFAILLKAGFKRWDAAKGQLLTASGALFGCLFGLLAEGAGDSSAWVLPFTSGGFIYIALVTVVPDLLKEDDLKESMKQIFTLIIGLTTMGMVTLLQH